MVKFVSRRGYHVPSPVVSLPITHPGWCNVKLFCSDLQIYTRDM